MLTEDEALKYENGRRKGQSKLVVTKGGVPFADQEQGLREFKDACAGKKNEDDVPIVIIKTTDLKAHVQAGKGRVRVQFAFYETHDDEKQNDIEDGKTHG